MRDGKLEEVKSYLYAFAIATGDVHWYGVILEQLHWRQWQVSPSPDDHARLKLDCMLNLACSEV
jgi:hypothetical protein